MAKLLIVDDDEDVRVSIASVFERDGHDVSMVCSGEDALTILSEQRVDLVITDLIMPGMNGVELITKVRADYPKIKIIAISGGGNFGPLAYQSNAITTTAYLAAATEAGANFSITKPFQRDEITKLVTSVLYD